MKTLRAKASSLHDSSRESSAAIALVVRLSSSLASGVHSQHHQYSALRTARGSSNEVNSGRSRRATLKSATVISGG